MAKKTFRFRNKNKYQRYNKNKQQKQQKQQATRKGKGLLSGLRGLMSRKKTKKRVIFKKFTPPGKQLDRSAAKFLTPCTKCAHLSQEEETASARKNLDKLIRIHVRRI